jgi:isoleucyl-tRNA synthetase
VNEVQEKLLRHAIGNEQALAQWLIVSSFEFVSDAPRYEVCGVKVSLAQGEVCPRCWNVSESYHEEHLCARCESILK